MIDISVKLDRRSTRKKWKCAQDQLDAVDRALGPWESAPGESVIGRVQTIRNLQARAAQASTAPPPAASSDL